MLWIESCPSFIFISDQRFVVYAGALLVSGLGLTLHAPPKPDAGTPPVVPAAGLLPAEEPDGWFSSLSFRTKIPSVGR